MKPTNYSFNLEKQNFKKKAIAELKLENGKLHVKVISDMKQINQETELCYSDLLETKKIIWLSFHKENFFAFVEDLHVDIPKLSFQESVSLESDLTLYEIKQSCLNILSEQQNPRGEWLFKRIL